MRLPRWRWMRLSLCLCLGAITLLAGGPLRFRITLDENAAPRGISGRLFVLMSDNNVERSRLETGLGHEDTWIAAMEVEYLAPGGVFEFDPDVKAFPHPFSKAKPGDFQFMALLDPDHSYARAGQDGGDLFGPVLAVEGLDPSNAARPIRLVLSKVTPARPAFQETDSIKIVDFESPSLTAFWGRPIQMHAAVVLLPSYARDQTRKYPAAYHVHGFGGDHVFMAERDGPELLESMRTGKRMEMVHILLDGSCPTGHHVFADSVNNGPWGHALTREFIPYLEKRFRLIPESSARFLTGHSSGGWSTLWLQVNYPDFFGGTWSTAPDPVDLRNFTGINVTPGSADNIYREHDGALRNLIRSKGRELMSFEDYTELEDVSGEYGGQIASFEWVWSPRGQGGRPMKLFNRVTGEQNPLVQEAWQKYDIHQIIERHWLILGPKLKGKLHLIVGSEDTFHLEESMRLLCDFLETKGFRGVCEVVPGRDHFSLYAPYKTYPDGLALRIDHEMSSAFEAASPAH